VGYGQEFHNSKFQEFQVPNREHAARFGAGNLGFDHRRRDSVFNLELGTLKLWNY
jgi:hypothetical protein